MEGVRVSILETVLGRWADRRWTGESLRLLRESALYSEDQRTGMEGFRWVEGVCMG